MRENGPWGFPTAPFHRRLVEIARNERHGVLKEFIFLTIPHFQGFATVVRMHERAL